MVVYELIVLGDKMSKQEFKSGDDFAYFLTNPLILARDALEEQLENSPGFEVASHSLTLSADGAYAAVSFLLRHE